MATDPRRDPVDPTTPRERTTTERTTERTTDRAVAADPRPLRGPREYDTATATEMWTWRDQVRWGPIVAGLVTALAVYILLSLLALGLGLTVLQAGEGVTGGITQDLPWISTIVAAAIGLAAFFVGGFVASSTAAPAGKQAGTMNGFLVWALGITFILIMGAFGLGQVFGAAGAFLGDLQNLALDIEITPEQATEAARDSALIGFAALALPAFAAALGGWAGAQDEDERIIATQR
jgi:hypothetical protein